MTKTYNTVEEMIADLVKKANSGNKEAKEDVDNLWRAFAGQPIKENKHRKEEVDFT